VSPSRSRNQYELEEEADYGPSRTQKRRDALAVLALAQQLVDLQPSRLAKLPLPDDVRHEIDVTRRTPSHGAKKRQLAFLAKVMRRYDDEDFAAVRAELGENREKQRQETAAMHRLEAMRDRLIAEDETALSELIAEHPQVDRQHLRSLVRQARVEKDTPNKPPRAYREIFQLLKDLAQKDDSAEG
jgi:ribosome-associated protein